MKKSLPWKWIRGNKCGRPSTFVERLLLKKIKKKFIIWKMSFHRLIPRHLRSQYSSIILRSCLKQSSLMTLWGILNTNLTKGKGAKWVRNQRKTQILTKSRKRSRGRVRWKVFKCRVIRGSSVCFTLSTFATNLTCSPDSRSKSW